MESWLVEEMDCCISEAWLSGSEDAFTQLLHLILSENVSVDYQVCASSQFSVTVYVVTIRGIILYVYIAGSKISCNSNKSWRCKQCSWYISVHCDTFEGHSLKLAVGTNISFQDL